MMNSLGGASALATRDADLDDGLDDDFTLNMRVVEALRPVPNLLLSTSDTCGNTCSDGATACPSDTADPS